MEVRFDRYEHITRSAGYITEPICKRGWPGNRNEHNAAVLDDFYAAVEWLLEQGFDEYVELCSNTISPVTQNAFIPLREYRVLRNGHYRHVKINARFLGGCYIEIA